MGKGFTSHASLLIKRGGIRISGADVYTQKVGSLFRHVLCLDVLHPSKMVDFIQISKIMNLQYSYNTCSRDQGSTLIEHARKCIITHNQPQSPNQDIFFKKIAENDCFKDKFRKYTKLHLYLVSQIYSTLYGFRGVAAQKKIGLFFQQYSSLKSENRQTQKLTQNNRNNTYEATEVSVQPGLI